MALATSTQADVQGLIVLEARDGRGAPYLGVSGELDFWTLDQFDAALKLALEENPERITLDFAGLRFIDSSGIGVLAGAMAYGVPIRIRRATPAVRRVFEYTGLDGHFLLPA